MTLSIGFGSGVITPDLPVVLAGLGGRKGPATGVRDDLTAQAVVLRDGATTLCLLVLDLLMLGSDLAGPLRQAVGAELEVATANVMTSCTHTHSGPAASRPLRQIGWPVPDAFEQRLLDGCLTAVREAIRRCVPATVGYARADLPDGLSMNRRGLPYDPSFSVLQAHGLDGQLIGTLSGIGIHPVALGITCTEVSGDWVTSFRQHLATVTGAPAVLLQGALGDVNPMRDPHTDPDVGGNWETAQTLGSELADCVLDLLPSCVALASTVRALPTRHLRQRAGLTIPALLHRQALRRVGIELLEWDLGGLRLVSVPGEAFHALGRAVERARDDKALLAGLSPDYLGYLPSPFGKGYEEKMSYGRSFTARVTQELLAVPR